MTEVNDGRPIVFVSLTGDQRVLGSSPSGRTIINNGLRHFAL